MRIKNAGPATHLIEILMLLKSSDPRVARVVAYISSHYSEQLTLGALAKEAGISKYHFIKLFAQATGQTPLAFLTMVRLEEARRLLFTTEMNVSEIACGYPRATHFATAFSSRYGMSPSRMREQAWI